jgi:opacity protein-like surface antigen
VTGNVGYNQQLGGGWFIEPSVGGVISHTSMDPLNVAGTLPLGTGLAFPGTVQIEDVESALGRASVRIGTNFTTGQIAWQPFITASVFHEFAGDVTTSFRSCLAGAVFLPCSVSAPIDFTGTTTTTRAGTFGQYAIGTAMAILNTGWLGYARFDYRSGEDIEGWNINAGLRYQFTPDQKSAGMKDALAAPEYAYNWTGYYLGGAAGITWGREDWFTAGLDTRDSPHFSGYLLGGQTGYNVQVGRFVFGVEGDFDFVHARGAHFCNDNPAGLTFQFFFTCESKVDRLASVAGRAGYTLGRALFYVKGGWAGGDVTVQTKHNLNFNVPLPVNGESKWLNGWTVGTGMEFALTDHWSAKAEYMYYTLGNGDFRIDSGLTADAGAEGNAVRIGVNYHFNPVRAPGPDQVKQPQ